MKWNKNANTTTIGNVTEQLAGDYLTLQNLTLLTRNFHSQFGEIDLIMSDDETVVFIEVKYRKNTAFGGGLFAIDKNKQKKIHLCAQYYLQQQGLNEYNTPCRFDIVTLEGDKAKPKVNWIKNAF